MLPFALSADTPSTVAGWVIWASVFLAAVSTIWRVAIRPGFRIAKTVDRIYDEFRENGGTSIKDQMNRLEGSVKKAVTLGEAAKSIAEAAQAAAEVGKALIQEERKRDIEFEAYVHQRFHDILDSLQAAQAREILRDEGTTPPSLLKNRPPPKEEL